MSVINEEIVTGIKFRTMLDKINKKWQLSSFWTKSSDVEFDDGENAETKLGAIKGITTDLNTDVEGYAADMTVVSQINSNISGIRTYVGTDGKIHFVDGAGADTALNFSKGYQLIKIGSYNTYNVSTYNCTGVSGYRNLTANDFIFKVTGFKYTIVNNIYPQSALEWSISGRLSYNASNGILTVTYVGLGAQNSNIVVRGDIYAYVKL